MFPQVKALNLQSGHFLSVLNFLLTQLGSLFFSTHFNSTQFAFPIIDRWSLRIILCYAAYIFSVGSTLYVNSVPKLPIQ